MKPFQTNNRAGFTIIELLTVIAIIALLSAILIPTVSRVRESARITQSRAQFSQWVTAIESFRTEYGHWPDFKSEAPEWHATERNAEDNIVIRINENRNYRRNFIEFLSGRHADGESWVQNGMVLPDYENHPNRRRISFYDFTENDYEFRPDYPNELDREANNFEIVDAFGNNDILIIMDGDNNGMIRLEATDEYGVEPNPNRSHPDLDDQKVPPYAERRDIRSRVIVYSMGAGGDTPDEARDKMIRTW